MKGYWPKLENKILPPSTSPITKTKSEAKQSPQSTSTPAKPVKVEGVERAVEKYKEIEEEAERQTSKCSKRVFSVRISAVFFSCFFYAWSADAYRCWPTLSLVHAQAGSNMIMFRASHCHNSVLSVASSVCIYPTKERTKSLQKLNNKKNYVTNIKTTAENWWAWESAL